MALALVALTVGLLRPANTAPILGSDGKRVPGSVAELTTVDQGRLLIRGTSTDNPVLLFLAGGPGGSEFGAMRRHLSELEQYFTVVTWDQRGAGTSYPDLDPTGTITLDGYVCDTIAVTNYLIGTGQMVSQLATDRIFYDDTLAWAKQSGNDGLVDELEAAGPPPYEAMFPYETALSHEQDVYPYDHTGNSEGSGQMSENLLVEEYTPIDQIHVLGAFMDTFAALYPQLQGVDFRETATHFDVPMFFVQGADEADGREQPGEFVDYMVGTVLSEPRA